MKIRYLVCIVIALLFLIGCATKNSDPVEDAQKYVNLGKKSAQTRNFAKAKKYFLMATEFDPTDYRNWGYAGMAARDNADFDEAIDYFEKVLKLRPHEIKAYGNMGVIYKKLKKYDKAIWAFNNVLKYDNKDMAAVTLLAEIHFDLKNYEECIIYINKFENILSEKNINFLPEKTKRKIENTQRQFSMYKKVIKE